MFIKHTWVRWSDVHTFLVRWYIIKKLDCPLLYANMENNTERGKKLNYIIDNFVVIHLILIKQSRAERRLTWGRRVRVHVGQTEDVVNVGREEAVAAMHVLAGVQIFMQTVYNGCHCLKRSLAEIYCKRNDKEVEEGGEKEEIRDYFEFSKISSTVVLMSQISDLARVRCYRSGQQ